MAYLTANNGPDQGRRYELRLPNSLVGRHPDCAIHVDVGAVSRQHAQIVRDGKDFYVEDLKSRNGTFVNDERVEGRLKLNSGDQLRVCDVAFTFSSEQPPQGHGAGLAIPATNTKPGVGPGMGTVFIDDADQESSSTIMSKLDVSSHHGRVQLSASPEAKLDALLEITRSLGKALALDEVLPQVLNSLFKIFVQADRGFIVMRTDDGRLIPMWTKVRRENAEDTIRISRTIVSQVMETQEAILSADAATDSRFEMSQSIADFRIRSMMCAPLVDSEGHSMGVLQIDTLDQRKRFQSEDLEVLASVASQAGIAIHAAQMHENALKQRAVERDLEVAHEVQRGFLPETPPDIAGYKFYDYYEPANHVGGDYYDYIRLPDGRIGVIVADVVGHGIAAALLMAKLSAEARYSLASEEDVATAVIKLNDAMCRLGLDRFVTMIVTVLNPTTHEVTIVNAGHMAPMLRHADGTVSEPGESLAGLPLGISAGLEYEQLTVKIAPGETVTMYTDGVNESMSAAGGMYGIDRIRKHVSDSKTAEPGELGQVIIDDVRRFLLGAQQDDDMCLVCYGRVEPDGKTDTKDKAKKTKGGKKPEAATPRVK
ncbi:MAG: SpoIIE family protein phosphatase [Pirellulaceae bacterium]